MNSDDQRTLVLVKPDAYGQADEIEERYRRAGFQVMRHRTVIPTAKLIALHYEAHEGKPFYQGTVDHMLSGAIFAMVISGPGVIQRVRDLNGPTDPTKAEKGHIRFDFGGKKMPANAVHASDSVDSATREIGLWFPD